mgnify:CR=1 FL=1
MSTLPIFDPINNVKIFNGSTSYLQIPSTSINLSNGFGILATFTPTSNVNNETLCSFFQGTSAANSFNVSRAGTTNQFNFNIINNAGITQSINLGNFATGIKYKLLVQCAVYVSPTGNNQILSQNVAKATYYTGTSIINSITGYATSATVNFTNTGYLSTTPLYVYLYNGTSWSQVVSTTCATTSVNILNLTPSQTSLYRVAMTVLNDGTNYQYNQTQSVYTSFNTPAIPTIGTISGGANQLSIGGATYSAGYVSGTAINYSVAVSPFTTYTNSTNSTLGTSPTIISGLTVNTQYQVRSIISDPASTTQYSSLKYTSATATFTGSPFSSITTTSFTVTWNSAGTPPTYSKININVLMTSSPFTQVYNAVNITAGSGIVSQSVTGLTANTSYTAYLTPVNGDNVGSSSVNTSAYTLATATLAATPITSITASGFTVNWNSSTSYSTINIRVLLTASPYTQVFSQTGFSGTSGNVTGLSGNTGYTVYIDAVNGYGTVNSSVASTTTTTLGTVSFAATPITSITTSGFTVNWISSSSYSSLNIRVNFSAGEVLSLNLGPVTSYTVTGLMAANALYTIYLDAYNVNTVINTAAATTTTYTLATVTLAATPITNLLDTSFTVNWNSSTAYTSIGVRVNLSSSPFNQVFSQTGFTGTSANVTGLTASTGYTVYLDAYNANSVNNGGVASTTTTTSAPIPLYTFSSFTFTNAATTGASGPSLATLRANAGYSAQSWTQDTTNNYLNMTTTGIQLWTVPRTGSYKIIAAGAAGYINGSGKGIIVSNTVSLTKGQVIKILVGQCGGLDQGPSDACSGGGGATFVVYNNDTPLLIAGGGAFGGNGTATPTLDGGSGNGSGGGGAGFSTNGGSYWGPTALSFLNGGTGGGSGGFGGGGTSTRYFGLGNGGGGGYNGGGNNGGGTSYDSINSGASYVATQYNTSITANGGTYTNGYCTGHGFVQITFMS